MKRFRVFVERTVEYEIEVDAERQIDAWRLPTSTLKNNISGLHGKETVFSISGVQEIKEAGDSGSRAEGR